MTLKDLRADNQFFTGKLSDIVRQLCFAGIGVVWILRTGKDTGGIRFDPKLADVLSAFCFALILDLLQYAYASAIWPCYFRYREKKGDKPDTPLKAPPYFNWPTNVLFWGKAVCCALGMYYLLRHLGKQI